MRVLASIFTAVVLLAGCAGTLRPPRGAPAQILLVRWQRLVNAADETCPRCALTQRDVELACRQLKRRLAPDGIRVILVTQKIDEARFLSAPLESNRIWIGDRPLEQWLGATTASSPCCDACGDAECRTVTVGGRTYEAIPADLIVRAGLMAASEIARADSSVPASGGSPRPPR